MKNQYKKIVESLKLLASSLEEQEKYLPDFADVPDDVTSSFENVFLLLPSLIENNKFSNASIASILRLNIKIQWCLRNVDLDDFSNSEWNKVREMAKNTLQIMGEPFGKPDLNYI
ncbi:MULTISPECIES: hypothetical protein [Chryseobacterium]|uniref:Uncharacterized protein n=2 Tax=Chryseobacterium gleum TaxID=250 RepID=A0A3S4MRT2_CHRGE|nr:MULTISPECIES: hypothetical protein [Chryseobacterium]EFK37831.1 hypothetical protein HMPREF0204_10604 [Chryseobacterium gleum ATCC 35910]MCC3213852.1 hypothetical protein [Chryseobacterium sp. X308]QQY32701.1 hypothetical protein I6I60_02620 [Chryseobacterium gleum]QRA43818.1 hypothetical protein JNG87_03425 [Chryseobacterium cucumeris]VEE10068.1 Uncharacterised protein [Chryseobacterium gleum]